MKFILRAIANRFSQYLVRVHLQPHFNEIKAGLSDISQRADNIAHSQAQAHAEAVSGMQLYLNEIKVGLTDISQRADNIAHSQAQAHAEAVSGMQLYLDEIKAGLSDISQRADTIAQSQAQARAEAVSGMQLYLDEIKAGLSDISQRADTIAHSQAQAHAEAVAGMQLYLNEIKAGLTDITQRADDIAHSQAQAHAEAVAELRQAAGERAAASAHIIERLSEIEQGWHNLHQQISEVSVRLQQCFELTHEQLSGLTELSKHHEQLTELQKILINYSERITAAQVELANYGQRLAEIQAALAGQGEAAQVELVNHGQRLAEIQAALVGQRDEFSELQIAFSHQQELALRDLYVIRQTIDPQQVRFLLQTDTPIAFDSPDHIIPWGTANDDTRNQHFNEKLYEFMGYRRPLYVLDLGCAGGGFVRSLLEDGHLALGLEGSDYSQKRWRAQWGSIPYHLKTCDITKPFTVLNRDTSERMLFDVITAWEVIEHIQEEDLDQFFRNIQDHLKPDGYFMGSVCTVPDADPNTNINWHQSVFPREWWIAKFEAAGFKIVEQDIIGKGDWLRGSGRAPLDWTEEQGFGFHIVLRRAARR